MFERPFLRGTGLTKEQQDLQQKQFDFVELQNTAKQFATFNILRDITKEAPNKTQLADYARIAWDAAEAFEAESRSRAEAKGLLKGP